MRKCLPKGLGGACKWAESAEGSVVGYPLKRLMVCLNFSPVTYIVRSKGKKHYIFTKKVPQFLFFFLCFFGLMDQSKWLVAAAPTTTTTKGTWEA
jgi:hypothetical protein